MQQIQGKGAAMIRKRRTASGETNEYHYEFMQSGKRYYGVCEGCTTERAALAYEKRMRDTAKAASEQKSVKALIENFREELTGGKAVTLADAFSRYLAKPKKRIPGEHQVKTNRAYWNDFTAFMTAKYPEAVNLSDVTGNYAEEYISLLRDTGAFVKEVKFSRQQGKTMIHKTYQSCAEKLSPRTINARQKAIKAVFSWLAADTGLLKNPFDVPTLDNETVSRDAFSEEELQQINKNMTMPYIRPIFTIGVCTGLSLGDICLLRWNEINDGWISNKRRRKTGVMLDIPLLPPLAAFLNEQRPVTGSGEFVSPELAEMYQTNPSGVMLRVRSFLEKLDIRTATKIEGRSRAVSTKAAHAIRHTFAYIAGVYSVPQPIVQSVLGHMSPQMTELYQRHSTREAKAKFLANMQTPFNLPSAAPALLLPAPEGGLERAELHRLANTLPVEEVRAILAGLSSKKT